jgi:hypothetical protein
MGRGLRPYHAQSMVGALLVVACHVLREHSAKVQFIEDEQVVEALVAQGPHDSLGAGVRLRGVERRQQRLRSHSLGTSGEVAAVHAVAIPGEVLGVAPPGRRFDALPPDPGGGGVGGHRHANQFPVAMRDEEEHGERAERERLCAASLGARSLSQRGGVQKITPGSTAYLAAKAKGNNSMPSQWEASKGV